MNFQLIVGTFVAMLAFAGNSVLCRMALESGTIDPATFTSVRLISGAIILSILVLSISKLSENKAGDLKPFDSSNPRANFNTRLCHLCSLKQSSWLGGLALFAYAAGFSFSYISLSTGTGALILFATVQITMITIALFQGSRFSLAQWFGFAIALVGLVYLFLPGISAPPIFGALLMVLAGIAWGVYSIMGKKVLNPSQSTTENFIRASLITLLLSLFFINDMSISMDGLLLAVASGVITSGIGYAIWYAVLPYLKSATSASVQLTVPVIATLGGIVFLEEDISLRLFLASIAILGGVAMVILLSKKA
ncbi:DMT family transporter [Glaciecola sp. MF2-115]|uniref:DMT family transporter n=1 Tax=Glaciecola sp. MF2-115 TaxID=3384827 RepID=UPI0039A24396